MKNGFELFRLITPALTGICLWVISDVSVNMRIVENKQIEILERLSVVETRLIFIEKVFNQKEVKHEEAVDSNDPDVGFVSHASLRRGNGLAGGWKGGKDWVVRVEQFR